MTRGRWEALGYAALLLGALLACGKKTPTKADPQVVVDKADPPDVYTPVTAADLIRDYKANEVKGDVKWKGKMVRITGVVGDIKKDILDVPFVILGSTSEFDIPVVQCSLADGQEARAANLTKGSRATLRGRVTGLVMNVQVEDCQVFVPGAPAPAPPVPRTKSAPRKR